MRIVDPKSFNKPNAIKKTRKHKKTLIYSLIVFIPIVMFALIILNNDDYVNTSVLVETVDKSIENVDAIEQEVAKGPINFSGNEFRLLYDNMLLLDTEKVDTPPFITGNDIADARIRQLAESRGYKLRNNPSVALTTIDGFQLQAVVVQPWLNMKQAAANAGLNMSIVSAYRSLENQRQLFLSRLGAEGINVVDVVKGTADDEINKVLVTTSIPGYSKHHSGYTFDLLCAGWEFENFKNSSCNEWLSKNNYENAKIYGFIPSYPIDADLQGPDPEAWEYVYVGSDLLINK